MRYPRDRAVRAAAGTTMAVSIFILVLSAAVGAFVWPYAINSWLVFFGKAAVVKWWQGAIIGFIPGIGKYGVIFAFFTWVLMLFLN